MSGIKESNHMSSSVVKKIEELLGNPSQLSSINMEELIQEMMQFFGDLKAKLNSSNVQEREEAMKIADELKSKLEEHALKLCESLGIDPQAVSEYVNTSAHFSPEEWQAIEKTKTELENYKNSFLKMNSSEVAAHKKSANKNKSKIVKEWIAG